MKLNQKNIINADKAAHQGNGYCTVHEGGGITFHGDPLATTLANQAQVGPVGGSCTVWLDHDDPRYVNEWARVCEMRKKYPNGLVSGGKCTPNSIFENVDQYNRGKGLTNSRRGYNTKDAAKRRHYASN